MSNLTEEDRKYLLESADEVEELDEQQQADRDYLLNTADTMDESRRGLLKDAGLGTARAVPEFGRSILDGLADIDEWLGRKVGVLNLNPFTGNGIEFEKFDEEVHQSPFRGLEQEVQEGLDIIPQTERWSGDLVEAGAKWAGWFVGAGKLKALQLIKNPWGRSVAAGAIADFAAFDEHEARLSDLLIQAENPLANNVLTQWLAADEDDEWYEGRFKNALEGGALGLVADGLILGVKSIRAVRKEATAAREAAEREADDVLHEQRMKDAEENPFEPEPVRGPDEDYTSRFEVREDAEGLQVLPKKEAGELGAYMDIMETEDSVKIIYPWIEPDARGARLGREMYRTAIEYALSKGKRFESDNNLSLHARRVWRSLIAEGDYVVVKNQNLDAPKHLKGAPQYTSDGGPMFVVEGRMTVRDGDGLERAAAKKVAIETTDDVDTMAQKIASNLGGKTSRINSILTEVVETGDVNLLLRELGDTINLRDVPADELSDMAMRLGQAVYRVAQDDPGFNRETVEMWLERGSFNLSEDLGVDIARLYTDMREGGGNAARLVGTLIGLADSMSGLAKNINVARAESISPRAVDEAMMQLEQLQYFSALASGNSSAAGRALRALRETKERLLKGVEDLKSEADKMEDLEAKKKVLEAVEQFVRDHNLQGTLGAARTAGWKRGEEFLRVVGYGNMLSALSTHKANTIGNAIRFAQGLLNQPLAYMGGRIKWAGAKLLRRDTSNMEFTSWDDVVGFFVGTRVGWDQAVRGTGALISRIVKGSEVPEQNLKEWAEESEMLGNLWKAIITSRGQVDNLTRIGDRPAIEPFTAEKAFEGVKWFESAPRYVKGFISVIIDTTGQVYSVPQRFIVAVDEMFKTIAFEQRVTQKAYSDFAADIRAGDLEIGEAAQIVHETQQRSKRGSLYRDAQEFAREQTFQKELGGIMGRFEAAVQAVPMGWLVAPFIRTPTNLFKAAVEMTGATPLMRAIHGAKGKDRDRAIGQLLVGSGFTFSLFMLAEEDRLRGGERRGDGIEPYSIRIGDKWYTFDRLDPLGMVLGAVADISEGRKNADTGPEADPMFVQMAGVVMSAVSQNLVSKTWLRGIAEFLDAATENDPDQSGAKWARFMAQAGTNLLPYAGSNLERREAVEQDDFSRYMFDVIDQLKARSVSENFGIGALVGDRQSLGIRRDVLGRPVKELSGRSTVVKESEPSANLLDHLLVEYGENWPLPARAFAKGKVRMDTNQYSRYMELRGQVVKIDGVNLEERLESLVVRSDSFNSLPTDTQISQIRSWFRQYQSVAKEKLLNEYPDLKDRVEAAEMFEKEEERRRLDANLLQPTADEGDAGQLQAVLEALGINQ